jgi:hypothetical protein
VGGLEVRGPGDGIWGKVCKMVKVLKMITFRVMSGLTVGGKGQGGRTGSPRSGGRGPGTGNVEKVRARKAGKMVKALKMITFRV